MDGATGSTIQTPCRCPASTPGARPEHHQRRTPRGHAVAAVSRDWAAATAWGLLSDHERWAEHHPRAAALEFSLTTAEADGRGADAGVRLNPTRPRLSRSEAPDTAREVAARRVAR